MTEVLYLLGNADRIVGISGFTVLPPAARREKPKASAFTSAKIGEILKLKPDLAIGFSAMQADIAQALIRRGVKVWISNHRSVAGILAYVRRHGPLVGAWDKAEGYGQVLESLIDRSRVYFEEWDVPQISGIRWVSELIGIAGGINIFPERAPVRWPASASLQTLWR
jgi:iron complex transport system substrate-binding protein